MPELIQISIDKLEATINRKESQYFAFNQLQGFRKGCLQLNHHFQSSFLEADQCLLEKFLLYL